MILTINNFANACQLPHSFATTCQITLIKSISRLLGLVNGSWHVAEKLLTVSRMSKMDYRYKVLLLFQRQLYLSSYFIIKFYYLFHQGNNFSADPINFWWIKFHPILLSLYISSFTYKYIKYMIKMQMLCCKCCFMCNVFSGVKCTPILLVAVARINLYKICNRHTRGRDFFLIDSYSNSLKM